MALRYDVSKIKNYKTVCYEDDDMCPNTEGLIFQLYLLRMSEITNANWKEFATRFLIANPFTKKQSNFSTRKRYEDAVVRAIRKHIGLQVWVDKYRQRLKGKWSDTIIKELHDTVFEDVSAIHERQEHSRLKKNARNRKYRANKKQETTA
tara:strand:- start:385 stop:834 length:450 start_codon:yes stop_codon:yes gene_type:complete